MQPRGSRPMETIVRTPRRGTCQGARVFGLTRALRVDRPTGRLLAAPGFVDRLVDEPTRDSERFAENQTAEVVLFIDELSLVWPRYGYTVCAISKSWACPLPDSITHLNVGSVSRKYHSM
jgi:uncharacterized protein (DUF1684 family)